MSGGQARPHAEDIRADGTGNDAPLFSIENLTVRFGTADRDLFVHAVNGVNLSLGRAETLAIVGESGCGKSVTSLAMMRLLPRGSRCRTGGRVMFEGEDLLTLPETRMRALRGSEIAMVFQDPMTSLNPVLRIGRQITEALTAHRDMGAGEARTRAAALLGEVGIADASAVLRRYPHELSGGMRQRVMIAMALGLQPKLLIADEPTTALDVTIQAQVLELMRALTRQHGTALVLITHDLGVVAAMTQRVAVMYAGYIVETAPTRGLFATPRHPYTVGLLRSLPRLDSDGDEELIPIEGAPPGLLREPIGCPFAPRCAWRVAVCEQSNPALASSGADSAEHLVACHNPVRSGETALGRPSRDDTP